MSKPKDNELSHHPSACSALKENVETSTNSWGTKRCCNVTILDKDVYDFYEEDNAVLGRGVNGFVRQVAHLESGELFALKTLVPHQRLTTEKILDEIEICSKLAHDNICRIIETFKFEDSYYLIFELCEGGDLYERLMEAKKFTAPQAARATIQMVDALDYLHSLRICHGDVKLENWVYTSWDDNGTLKLIDFGYATVLRPGESKEPQDGSLIYVAPEMIEGKMDLSTDMWSLGVICFMLISGDQPFTGCDTHNKLLNIRHVKYNFQGPEWETVSEIIMDFIQKLLVKDPKLRYTPEQARRHPWIRALITQRNMDSCDSMSESGTGSHEMSLYRKSSTASTGLFSIADTITPTSPISSNLGDVSEDPTALMIQ